MTFGETLKQLLSISGVKIAQLARELGYDVSYISRWTNDIKIPSLKNNDGLFNKIANIAISNCDDASLEKLKRAYLGKSNSSSLEDSIVSVLYSAYDLSLPVSAHTITPNAAYLTTQYSADINEMFASAVFQYAKEIHSIVVNCITSTPLSLYSNKDTAFWSSVLTSMEYCDNVNIVMHQIINMKDFSRHIDSYCAAICTYAYYRSDIRYEFYKDESDADIYSNMFTAVEDIFLLRILTDPVINISNVIVCANKSVLAPNYLALKNKLQMFNKLLDFCSSRNLYNNHFLYDYVMDGGIRYLLNMMHPIYMCDTFAARMAAEYTPSLPENEFQIYYNSLCSNSKKEVIIFRSTILEYIFSGKLYLFGQVLYIGKKDRIEHIEQLLNNIEQGGCSITILNDDNPLLCQKDMRLSVYLSQNLGFACSCTDDFAFTFRSHRAVKYFNQFFEHLQGLGPEYILREQDAVDFIRRGLMLI